MQSLQIFKHPECSSGYRLTSEITLPVSRDEVFPLFADARQLERLTPSWLHFSVLTPPPIEMQVGTRIDYKLRLHGVPVRWKTRISCWEPPFRFVDEQLQGPYRKWVHLHTFEQNAGQTICRDQVDYDCLGGWLVHELFVRRDLQRIFTFRQQSLARMFASTLNQH